jgi:hypothetical protein
MSETNGEMSEQPSENEATTAIVDLLESQAARRNLLTPEDRQTEWVKLLETHIPFETEIRTIKKTLDSTTSAKARGAEEKVDMIDHPFSFVEDPVARELLTSALITRTGASTQPAAELEVAALTRGDHAHIIDQDDLMREARVMADILGIRNGVQLAQIDSTHVVRAILTADLLLERSEPYQDKPKTPREALNFTSIHSTDKSIVGVDDHPHPEHATDNKTHALDDKAHPSNK